MRLEKYLPLYFITDSNFGYKHEELTEMALKAGVKTIQFREKRMSTKEMYEIAKRIRKLTEEYSALFIVNDRLDIALAADADGLHVGQDDLPAKVVRKVVGEIVEIGEAAGKVGKIKKVAGTVGEDTIKHFILGVSVSNVSEALKAERDGADYLGAGPIFRTSTKEDAGDAIGISGLKEIVNAVSIPVVAIGGINHSNANLVLETGCAGIAVISAIAASKDPRKSAEELIKIVREFKEF
ncbi:MAG: thiamine phosphate synthase [Archaeoglobus sp.]|nr:thiamine phosphate synthase [Archaeoglobus sp.]